MVTAQGLNGAMDFAPNEAPVRVSAVSMEPVEEVTRAFLGFCEARKISLVMCKCALEFRRRIHT